ncbi:hypothetical protein Zmor_000788 [Zophobas morio]|uniref:Uncharacterized protein n=1 Tax=Zophobas morio TaxID=2755281 RepID=A0AA38MNT3_9CUCU|nr:hypothetical protein Zmor_000787 [Zophobas morio]KAJ3665287.1 hypothetical protein Zmor_000788 [Zophobas morio]
MALKTTFLLCAFLALASADLANEAKEAIEALKGVVQDRILAAHSDLDIGLTTFLTNSENVASNAARAILELQETIDAQLQEIKDLALEADISISPCTNVREQALNKLPGRLIEELGKYVSDAKGQASSATISGFYLVDILINKVQSLDFQLHQCQGDLLCIAPLLTEVENHKVQLVQNVDTEFEAVEYALLTLKLNVQSYSDSRITTYIRDGFDIVRTIRNCANNLIV